MMYLLQAHTRKQLHALSMERTHPVVNHSSSPPSVFLTNVFAESEMLWDLSQRVAEITSPTEATCTDIYS